MRFEAWAEPALILEEKLVIVFQDRAEVLDRKLRSRAVAVLVGVIGRSDHLPILPIDGDGEILRQAVPVAPEVPNVHGAGIRSILHRESRRRPTLVHSPQCLAARHGPSPPLSVAIRIVLRRYDIAIVESGQGSRGTGKPGRAVADPALPSA